MLIERPVKVNASAHSRRGSNFPPVDPAASRNKSCVATTSQTFSLDAAPRIKNQFVATLTARQQEALTYCPMNLLFQTARCLFVTQGIDWIDAAGAEGWYTDGEECHAGQ